MTNLGPSNSSTANQTPLLAAPGTTYYPGAKPYSTTAALNADAAAGLLPAGIVSTYQTPDGLFTYPGSGTTVTAVNGPINPPSGFNFPFSLFTSYSMNIYKTGRKASTDIEPQQFIDPACYAAAAVAYHVDPSNGSDSNTGVGNFDGDFRAAINLATIGKAITLGNATSAAYRIILKGGQTYAAKDIIFSGNPVWPTQSLCMIGYGSQPAILTSHSDPASWTLVSGTQYVSAAAVPNSSATNLVSRVLDLTNKSLFQGKSAFQLPNGTTDFSDTGAYTDLTYTTSIANCLATANSFFFDTASLLLYVNRGDGAAPTAANTRPILQWDILGCTTTFLNKVFYIENIECHGGKTAAFYFKCNSVNSGKSSIVGDRVAFRYSGAYNANGLGIDGCKIAIMSNWEASGNGADGYNVHDNGEIATANGYSVAAISINGHGYDNGRSVTGTSSQSCNGFTTHDGIQAIELNSWHHDNYGGNCAHVSVTARNALIQTMLWAIGNYYGDSHGNYPGSATLQNAVWSSSATFWLDSCKIRSKTAAIAVDGAQNANFPGAIYTRNCIVNGTTSVAGGSTLTTY